MGISKSFQEIKALPIKIVYLRATVTESRSNGREEDNEDDKPKIHGVMDG